jgi:putative membrane protein
MKSLESFRTTPLAAAVLLSGLLFAAAGCNRKAGTDTAPAGTADTATPADATTADTATTPTDATAANDTMGSGMNDTTAGNMSGASTADTTGTSASDMTGASDTAMASDTDAMASGPVTDTQFYTQALRGGEKEIAASQMVSRQSTNADIKQAATKIASDHTAMGKKITSAAGSKVTAPTADSAMTASLQGKTGADLDRAYLDQMVTDHQKAIAMFENAAKNASTPEAKKLATDGLPKLRDHLKTVQQLQQKSGSK